MTRSLNALLALAALGFASTSFAQCPASAVPPWSSQSTLGGALAISGPGLDGTACRLNSRLTANIGGSNATVRDNTPAGESRYRGQFFVNADALTGQNLIQGVRLFAASTETPNLGVSEVVRLAVIGNAGGTAKTLSIFTACAEQPSGVCSATTALPAGSVRIEFDWQKSATGSLRVWVNNTTEGTPTATIAANNAAWGGVDFAVLGLANASPGFRASQLNRDVQFDEFDSRRQTFIGL
jgi:hypothetical protein